MESKPCLVDLHQHSTFSDGTATPAQLCHMAQGLGVVFTSLTDHDTTGGIPEAAQCAKAHGLHFVPGVELGCGEDGRTHVLCYGRGVNHPAFAQFLQERAHARQERGQAMLHRLQEAELLPWEISLPQTSSLGRPHLARLLMEAGKAHSIAHAFQLYLSPGKVGYEPHPGLRVGEVLERFSSLPLVFVLAHPLELGLSTTTLHTLIQGWKQQGLQGVECYHPSATPAKAQQLDRMARSMGLLVTGGSDTHGDPKRPLGQVPQPWLTCQSDAQALFDFCSQKE